MATKLGIFNMAIGICGQNNSIQDDDENSAAAIICRVYYDQAVTSMLQAGWWNFAQRIEYLSLLAAAAGTPENLASGAADWLRSDPAPPWLYAYAAPGDSVQLRYILTQDQSGYRGPHKFRVNTRLDTSTGQYITSVSTNASKAIACYTCRLTDPSMFPPLFSDALIARLASDMCVSFTGDLKLKDKLQQTYATALAKALVADANEGFGEIDLIPLTLEARGFPNNPLLDAI